MVDIDMHGLSILELDIRQYDSPIQLFLKKMTAVGSRPTSSSYHIHPIVARERLF
jgi:hypothetical protein